MATATQRRATSSHGSARSSNGGGSDSGSTQAASRARNNGGEGSGPRSSAAASRARSSQSRGGSSGSSKRSSSRGRGATAASSTSASRTRGRAGGSSRSRSRSSGNSNGNGSEASARERAGETISSAANGVRDTAMGAGRAIGVPVATGTLGAAAGVAGGVLLGRTIAKRPKKVLGMKIPHRQTDFSDVARSINAAGKQFGRLASEVHTARQKAEEIGKVLT